MLSPHRRAGVGVPARAVLGQVGRPDVMDDLLGDDGRGSQHEGHKQIHVDVVAGAVQLPGNQRGEH